MLIDFSDRKIKALRKKKRRLIGNSANSKINEGQININLGKANFAISSNSLPAQTRPQKRMLKRHQICALCIVGRAAMSPFNVLVIKNIMPLLDHSSRHFSSVPRMNSVIPC